MAIDDKYGRLFDRLQNLQSVLVAFSGGVDSTLLLKAALDALGPGRAVAFIGASPLIPEAEIAEARDIAMALEAPYVVAGLRLLDNPAVAGNPRDRCYFCKSALLERAWRVAKEQGIEHIAEGSNVDDARDFRPGTRAVREKGVESPLFDAGLSKGEIRELAKRLGLSNHARPANACLATRVPYGTPLTAELLGRIDEAERYVREATGIGQVRVRWHGGYGRIEVPSGDVPLLIESRSSISEALRGLGFLSVSVDLEGYRTGSMNEEP